MLHVCEPFPTLHYEFGEKHKIRAITLLNVIQGHRGRYQSKAHMRLPISD